MASLRFAPSPAPSPASAPAPWPAAGAWLHNPATGEIAHVAAADPGGRRLEVDLWLQPGAAVARAHVHDHVASASRCAPAGSAPQVAGHERVVRPGDAAVVVPAGTVHDWWNDADGIGRSASRSRRRRRRPAGRRPGSRR